MVRHLCAALASVILCAGAITAAEPGPSLLADDTPRQAKPVFVNHKVSSRTVALNQPVRLEFITVPRQIEGVDIAAVVANGINLASGSVWKLLGKPSVVEHEKLKTVTISVTLLPRTTGELRLPQFGMSWLSGDPLPDFGVVAVGNSISIGGETKRLPNEYEGLGGFPWGATLAELRPQLPKDAVVDGDDDQAIIRLASGLELRVLSGQLAEGSLSVAGMTIDQARGEFLSRWGLPLSEQDGRLLWSIGWLRLSVSASGDGLKLDFVREDQRLRQSATKVRSQVFNALEGQK
jgi:hypothetical protein